MIHRIDDPDMIDITAKINMGDVSDVLSVICINGDLFIGPQIVLILNRVE